MKIEKSVIYKIAVILLLGVIILLLGRVVFLVTNHAEAFEENPLLFGANKYSVSTCMCSTTEGKRFNFNTTSLWSERLLPDTDNALNISRYNLSSIFNAS